MHVFHYIDKKFPEWAYMDDIQKVIESKAIAI